MDQTAATQDLAPSDDEAATVIGGAAISIPVPDIPGLNLAGKTIVLVPGVLQITVTGKA
jgi:hypothetical protein